MPVEAIQTGHKLKVYATKMSIYFFELTIDIAGTAYLWTARRSVPTTLHRLDIAGEDETPIPLLHTMMNDCGCG